MFLVSTCNEISNDGGTTIVPSPTKVIMPVASFVLESF